MFSTEISQGLPVIKRPMLTCQSLKQSIVQFVQRIDGFKRIEGPSVWLPRTAQSGGNSHIVYIIRSLCLPALCQRLEVVAMRTAVPEHFRHLNAGVGFCVHRGIQFFVMRTFLPVGRIGLAEYCQS